MKDALKTVLSCPGGVPSLNAPDKRQRRLEGNFLIQTAAASQIAEMICKEVSKSKDGLTVHSPLWSAYWYGRPSWFHIYIPR